MKYFTLEEANRLLPTIRPLVSQLLDKRARAAYLTQSAPDLLRDTRSNIATPLTSELTQLFVDIERLTETVQAHGCVVKSVNAGLVDFLHDNNGRDVYLCWQYDEPQIDFYHELHSGFNGRQPIAGMKHEG